MMRPELLPSPILTIDPGKRAACALWAPQGASCPIPRVCTVSGDDPREIMALLRVLRPELGIVEAVHPVRGKGGKIVNLKAYATMLHRAHHWHTLLQAQAIPTREVQPLTWQNAIPGMPSKAKRDERITIYRAHASDLMGRKLTEDEAAAVGIGCWWLAEQGIEANP